MKSIFLESHNLKNKFSGFGQFNYHLIKAMSGQDLNGLRVTLNAKKPQVWKSEFGNVFEYKKYQSITRHKPFRIKKKYDLWHSLNQNIKIEPFHDIPYLLTVHDIHFIKEGSDSLQKKLREKFEEKLARCNAIVYISEFAKKDTNENFKVPDIPQYVIHNGNTITETDIPRGYTPDVLPKEPYLFSIGDFSERKNFMSLIEMLRLLPEYNLVLSGNDHSIYADKLKDLVSTYELTDRVFITGKIEDLAKKYYLQNCEAFVFPSHREGFGIPPIEAMRFGKPIFVSNNTSLPEIGGEHAFYWDRYDPEYMVKVFDEGMKKYQSNQEFYSNWYIERAQSFNWDSTARLYLEVYRRLLAE